MKAFSAQQIKQINNVCLALQLHFISDILRPMSNRMMDCYSLGSIYKCSKISYDCPKSVPSTKDVNSWKWFLSRVNALDQLLLRSINSSREASCHMQSTALRYLEKYLMQVDSAIQQWVLLRKCSRNLHYLRQECLPNSYQL